MRRRVIGIRGRLLSAFRQIILSADQRLNVVSSSALAVRKCEVSSVEANCNERVIRMRLTKWSCVRYRPLAKCDAQGALMLFVAGGAPRLFGERSSLAEPSFNRRVSATAVRRRFYLGTMTPHGKSMVNA